MEFTKEQLIEQAIEDVNQWREVQGVHNGEQYAAIHLRLAEITLAVLTAEPEAYIFDHPAGKLFRALTDKSNAECRDVFPIYRLSMIEDLNNDK